MNFSDPLGLCPPEDHDPCNMKTGDPNLDDPDRRNIMEDKFKESARTKDSEGRSLEMGGSCNEGLQCEYATGSDHQVGVPQVNNAIFEFHTHPNQGFVRLNSGGVQIYPMPPVPSADFDLAPSSQTYPGYVIGPNNIWRVDYQGLGKAPKVTSFDRWKN